MNTRIICVIHSALYVSLKVDLRCRVFCDVLCVAISLYIPLLDVHISQCADAELTTIDMTAVLIDE